MDAEFQALVTKGKKTQEEVDSMMLVPSARIVMNREVALGALR